MAPGCFTSINHCIIMKKVRRSRCLPRRAAKRTVWLENWRLKLPDYAAELDLDAAEVTGAVADARWLIYVHLSWLPAIRVWSQACTAAVKEADFGRSAGPLSLPTFVPPDLPDDVAPRPPGALARILGLSQRIKDSPRCTAAIATDLGVVGAEEGGPDLTTLRPPLRGLRVAAGVRLSWSWGGHWAYLDALELQVDRNDGKGWVVLNILVSRGCLDQHPQPAEPAVWKYRAIYHVDDRAVGQWSGEVSVAVGG